jgi:glycogen synthase
MASRAACILSLTPVTDEPRVIRQASALLARGWQVTVCGYRGQQAAQAGWRFIEVAPGAGHGRQYERLRFGIELVSSRANGAMAEAAYWRHGGYEAIYEQIDFVDGIGRCDLVLGHDYFTAPIVAKIAARHNIPFSLDIHEYAAEQYMHDRQWVWFYRPWVHALQRRYLPRAAVLTTICEGIAAGLAADYSLRSTPVVVRSAAAYQEMPLRSTGQPINVLYHGILCPMRGLEETIRSVPLWRAEFHLVIRGNGPSDYVAGLRRLAAESGVADRVRIEPPVLFSELVRRANEADIGYFVQPEISRQKRFTLPNKFFEYIMAGLALCVADLPEMARLIHDYDFGRVVSGTQPEQIAAVVNSFTPVAIDAYKRRSLAAAKILNWEREADVMVDSYEAALAATS